MSLVTHSKKKNRDYQRAFDHEEAARLREQGWTQQRIADHFGVSVAGVRRVLVPSERARMDAYSKRWIKEHYKRPCIRGCGRLAWHHPGRRGICQTCATEEKTMSVRPDALLCSRCGKWKPDEEFPLRRGAMGRRQRAHLCRPCSTITRREHRQRNPQHREHDLIYRRAKREREKQMTTFIVLQPNGDGYHEVAKVEAASAIGAVEKAATTPGDYIAVAEGRFRTLRVEPVQKLAVVPQGRDSA